MSKKFEIVDEDFVDSVPVNREKDVRLTDELLLLLNNLRGLDRFDGRKWISNKCNVLNKYMRNNKLSGCVLNVSGGVDSAIVLGILKHASLMRDSPIKQILAIAQPIKSSNWALNRAQEVSQHFGIRLVTIDQSMIFENLRDTMLTSINNNINNNNNNNNNDNFIKDSYFASGQLKSYMRAPVAYYGAQLLNANGYPSIVIGTGNMDEDGYLGYFCKAGDGVVDIQLIMDLHKSQVFEIGQILNIPQSILKGDPSPDLWPNHTTENELGIPYIFIELLLRFNKLNKNDQNKTLKKLNKHSLNQFIYLASKSIEIRNKNKHKFSSPHAIASKL